MKIIVEDRFTKMVNTQRTPSPTSRPALKTTIPGPRIVALVSDWYISGISEDESNS